MTSQSEPPQRADLFPDLEWTPPADLPRRLTDAERAVIDSEQSLLSPRVRGDRAAIEALLAPDFQEFGVSGHAWERSELIDALLAEPDVSDIAMSAIDSRQLTPQLVLLTYVTENQGVPRARRSSLWRLDGDSWRLVHHQGSPYT